MDARDKPIAGLRIEAFDQDPKSPHDPLGEPATTDSEGAAIFRFKLSDFTEHQGEKGPDLYFKVYRGKTLLEYSLPSINNDKGVIRGFQPQREHIVLRVNRHYVVAGVIVQPNRMPAKDQQLLFHRIVFGRKSEPLGPGTVTVTGTVGCYAFAYDPGAGAVNLEIQMPGSGLEM